MKWYSIFLFFCSLTVSGQVYTLERIQDTPLVADVFYGVDKFEAAYFSKGKTLYKKSAGKNYQFTALQLGDISSVDILNPLKITVFYTETNTAVILDNTLTEIKYVRFSSIENFRNVSHARTANDRRLWIFNTDNQRLELFDYQQEKVVVEFPPKEDNASAMTSNFNFCWIATEQGVFKYNNYGSFIARLESDPEVLLEQSLGSLALFSKPTASENDEAKLYYIPKENTTKFPLEIIDLSVKQFSMHNERLYIYDGQKLTSFEIIQAKK